MKKIVLGLVLALLLSGCQSTSEVINSGNIKKGITKIQLKRAYASTGTKNDIFYSRNCFREYFPDKKIEILSSNERDVWYVFEKVNFKKKTCGNKDFGDGYLYAWTPDYAEAKKYVENYNASIKTTNKPEKKTKKKAGGSSGTAFFISNNYLITNHHVIKGCNNNSKIIYQTKEINTQLIAKDKFLDLALLKVDVDNDTYISISGESPSKLQRIIAAGYPFGKYLSDDIKFTSGIVSSLKGLGDDSTRLQIDAALNPGNSGGPIVDENTGELVAVAVAGLRKDKTEAVNFGIKAASVKNFLQSNQIDTTLLKKRYSRAGVASLLESATMYTFCN